MDLQLLKLYEFPQAVARLAEMVGESDGEITPEIREFEERLGLAFNAKVAACSAALKEMESAAKATRDEAKRLAELARRRESQVESFKRYLVVRLREMGLEGSSIKTPSGNMTVVKNSRPAIDWDYSYGEIPDGFRRTKTEVVVSLDKEAAHDAEQAGVLPDGFIVVHGYHLRTI